MNLPTMGYVFCTEVTFFTLKLTDL